MPGGGEYRVRIETHGVNADFHQILGHLGIVRRRLPADTRMATVAACAFHREADHLFHAGVALIEIEGDDLGIAIHAQGQLSQVVGADGETVEDFSERVDQDDVVRDLAHDVNLQPIVATLEAVHGHGLKHLFALLYAATKRNHQLDVNQSHFVAHPSHRRAFQRKSFGVGGMCITGSAAESDHRIVFFRLKKCTAQQGGVFIAFEVAHTHHTGLWINRRGYRGDPFGKSLDEEILRAVVGDADRGDLFTCCGIHLLRVYERHRVHLDVFIDNEFHARQSDAIHGQRCEAECLIRIAQVHHDLGFGVSQLAEISLLDIEIQYAFIDITNFAFGAADGDRRTGFDYLSRVSGSHDGGNAQFT